MMIDDSNNDSDDEMYHNLQNYLLNKIIKFLKIIMLSLKMLLNDYLTSAI
jgi:hypothetical protein